MIFLQDTQFVLKYIQHLHVIFLLLLFRDFREHSHSDITILSIFHLFSASVDDNFILPNNILEIFLAMIEKYDDAHIYGRK